MGRSILVSPGDPQEYALFSILFTLRKSFNNLLMCKWYAYAFSSVKNTMPDIITVDKDKEHFFIAICKQGNHTFLMLGVYDGHQVSHLLCRVGKVFDVPAESDERGCNLLGKKFCNAFFYNNEAAAIQDEGVSRKKKGEIPISYQAYELKYENYLEFIKILEGLQIKNPRYKYRCYKPVYEEGNQVWLKPTREIKLTPKANLDELHTVTDEIGIKNTCRHGAIKLVEEVRQIQVSPMVSSNFFTDLPYKTELDYGKPSLEIPFYVLPFPPESYSDLSKEKKEVITKLYLRMERMLLIDPYSLKTQQKFQSLKELYNDISGPQKDLTLDELLLSIQVWKETNKANLNNLRETFIWDYFFTRQSATSKLINEIEQDLMSVRIQ